MIYVIHHHAVPTQIVTMVLVHVYPNITVTLTEVVDQNVSSIMIVQEKSTAFEINVWIPV